MGQGHLGHLLQWDARLTTTVLLFVTYLGYLALRRLPLIQLWKAGGDHGVDFIYQRPNRALLGRLVADSSPKGKFGV